MSNSIRISRRTALMLGGAAALAPTLGFAQAYPAKTISFICASPAGSGADIWVRYLANKVAEVSGATIIVENRPGALGNIATEYTARSAPDGYTVLVHSPSALAAIMWTLKNPPVDVVNDLTTIATTHTIGFMITVRADSPYQTLAELVEDQKKKGDSSSYAANNISGIVLAEEFKQVAGLETVGVQYRSAADSLNDMLSGRVDWGAHEPTFTLSQIREGRLRALAIGSAERIKSIPDIPTFKEQGFNIVQPIWWGAMVHKDVPQDIIEKLNGWINEVLATEETRKFVADAGGDTLISSASDSQKLMVESAPEWKRLVELGKIPQQ